MNMRWPKISLGTRAGLGFLLVLVLLVIFMLTGMTQMSSINQRVNQFVSHDAVKVELVHKMISALHERMIIIHVITLMTDPFDQDEEYMKHAALGGKFLAARGKLLAMQLSDEEQAVLEQIRKLAATIRPLIAAVNNYITNEQNLEAQNLIHDTVAPLQYDILRRFEELLLIQQRNAQATVAMADAAYIKARQLMIVLGSIVGLLGLGIAVIVVRLTNHQARLLQHQALYDGLTELPNRSLFTDRLQQTMLVCQREEQSFGLIAMDLNLFKEVNDTLGHQAGDEVLQTTARLLRLCLRESDTIARMGGDEFSIILPSTQTLEGTAIVAKRILKKLRKPIMISGHEIEISASLGLAQFPEHSDQIDALQRQADSAMYQAKRTRAGYVAFNEEFDHKINYHLELQTALRKALKKGELVLHYQPKIEFSSHSISGVEALVRWQHPTRGLLSPDKFIPLAEKSELIRPLTEYVLRMAIKQAATWLNTGMRLSIAVNVSAINIEDVKFAGLVQKILDKFQLPPELLELELTESAVMHKPEQANQCIRQLHKLGVLVSIDDFGTGYTSMSQLKELLVAKIKIDRSFVKNMVVNHNDAVIVRTAVDLGHNLGFKVVAEGVEDQETWDQLEALGCDSAQGFHMGKPLPPEAFIEWLNSSPWGNTSDKEPHSAGQPGG